MAKKAKATVGSDGPGVRSLPVDKPKKRSLAVALALAKTAARSNFPTAKRYLGQGK